MFFDKFRKQSVAHADEITKIQPPSDTAGLDKFVQSIKNICGVDLYGKKDTIKTRLANFCQERGLATFEELALKVVSNAALRQEALNLITINETYFLREQAQLDAAVSLAAQKGYVRILCAPCSSGEEVYSLGILSHAAMLDISKISIVGIDINSQAIDRCFEATYSARSLHRLHEAMRRRYFDGAGDKFKIKKELLPRCEFSVVNIFDDSIFRLGKFDIIFSRNMMIYFDEEYKLKTVERFHKILNEKGRLYTGHADLVPYTSLYNKITTNGAYYYEKG